MSWSMTARARWTSLSTRSMRLDKMGMGLGMRETRVARVFVAGAARSLALAAVCDRVLRAGAESGTFACFGSLRHLVLGVGRGAGMATGVVDVRLGWLVMERVMRCMAMSVVGSTLGSPAAVLVVRTLGTQSEVFEVDAVMSSSALRSVLSLVGAVMPLSAAAHAETACMSLSVGVREG